MAARDELSEIIARMINYVSLEQPVQQPRCITADKNVSSQSYKDQLKLSTAPSYVMSTKVLSTTNDWGGVLLRQANLYLRFALTIDLAIEKVSF
jgi:hypothetical protein